jgi:hypothetical protein
MGHETFADGIGRIAIIDGIVRLDLISYSPTEHGPDGKPRQVFTHRVVMGMDQFLFASEKIARTAEMIRQQAGPSQPQSAKPQAAPAQVAPVQAAPAAPKPAAPVPQVGPQPPPVAPQFRRENIKPEAPEPSAAPPPPQRPFP